MKKLQINPKEVFKSIGILCLYFFLQFLLAIIYVVLTELKVLPFNDSLYNFFVYVFMSLSISLIYIKTIIKDFKDFRHNYKAILKTTFNYWLKGLFISYLGSIIITMFNLPEVTNQSEVVSLLKDNLLLSSFMTIILAPITEELFFRRGLRKFTNNKHLYAFTSGLIFGGLHLITSIHGLNDLPMLLYLIPYSSLGVAFAYAYYDTDNIYGSICLHAMHNSISIILSLFLTGGIL